MAYPWSSFGLYLAAREHRPGWLRVDRLLGEHGIEQDTAHCRQRFEKRMEASRAAEQSVQVADQLRRGWCLGSAKFKERMLERMEGKLGAHHSGKLRMESAQAKAERIIAEELGRLGWEEGQLNVRRKNDPGKLGMAARLRRETTLSLKEIARRVVLGSSKSANATLHKWMSRKGGAWGSEVRKPAARKKRDQCQPHQTMG
jgi:hypothetical protein